MTGSSLPVRSVASVAAAVIDVRQLESMMMTVFGVAVAGVMSFGRVGTVAVHYSSMIPYLSPVSGTDSMMVAVAVVAVEDRSWWC